MKLLNGALTIGTLDGANIEIREAVGADNIFIFGHTAEEIAALGAGYDPRACYEANGELRQALDMIRDGFFSPGNKSLYHPLCDALLSEGDRYRVLADYASYLDCQRRVALLYRDPEAWSRAAVLNVARMGWFSSDRTVAEYARTIWRAPAVAVAAAENGAAGSPAV